MLDGHTCTNTKQFISCFEGCHSCCLICPFLDFQSLWTEIMFFIYPSRKNGKLVIFIRYLVHMVRSWCNYHTRSRFMHLMYFKGISLLRCSLCCLDWWHFSICCSEAKPWTTCKWYLDAFIFGILFQLFFDVSWNISLRHSHVVLARIVLVKDAGVEVATHHCQILAIM